MLTQSNAETESTLLSIIKLLRWDKPAGRLILMLPALWAVFLASAGTPELPLVGVIIFGTLSTSAAGCAINDLWDRDIDPQVERTRTRPLASRALTVRVGIVVAFLAMACAGVLALYLNPLCFWLCVAAVPVIICYPLAKRVFPVPQLVLSIAWGFAVLISWTAAAAELETATWLLWGAVICWTLGFDTVYAMSDREDDKRIGINSSAIFFGDRSPEAVGFFFLLTVGLLAALAIVMELHLGFWLALVIATAFWSWQYARLRNHETLKPYPQIFRENVAIGFILLVGMIVGMLL